MHRFDDDAASRAWALAEELSQKGLTALRQAEEAAEVYRSGKLLSRRRCRARGMGDAEADIRWSASARAKKALQDNEWFTSHARMYSEAAAAQYAKALLLAKSGAGSRPL